MTFFESIPQFAAACGVVLVAQAVYVMLGFGAGLIAVGGLALVVPDLRDVVVLLLLVSFPSELLVVLRSRREIDWRGSLRLAVGVVAGIPIGTWLLGRIDASTLLLALGAVLCLVGGAFLALGERGGAAAPPWVGWPTGAVSGLLTGLFGTGGPPLIIYYRLTGHAKGAFRGNLMALFLLMTFVRAPVYGVAGLLTAPRFGAGLAVLPAVLAGAWLGQRVHVEMSESAFRRTVAVGLLAIGALLLLRGHS